MTKNGLDIFYISRTLNRSQASILGQLHRLGVPYRPRTKEKRYWTEEEVKTLIKLKDRGESDETIANVMGRSVGSVRIKHSRIMSEQTEYKAI